MITFKEITELSDEMCEDDIDRNKLFDEVDNMFKGIWNLPSPLNAMQGIIALRSTDPHDAIRTGTRVMSSLNEIIRYDPLTQNEEAKHKSADVERWLRWHLYNASRRRNVPVKADLMSSALKYDEIAAQIIYLPLQRKAMGELKGKDKTRWDIAEQDGPFAIVVENPRNIHTRRSPLMLECVVVEKEMTRKDIIDFWGDKAKGLKNLESDVLVYREYWDWETRCVYVKDQDKEYKILEPMEHGLPFLPWACRIGGTSLEDDPAHQRIPMLYSVYQTKQWINQNIALSLEASEVLAHALAPKIALKGAGSENIDVEYGSLEGRVNLGPGQDIQQLSPPMMDRQVLEFAQSMANAIDKSTVSRVLQGGTMVSNTSFAAQNLTTQMALGALKPYQNLAERALEDICKIMMLSVKEGGKSVKAHGIESKRNGDRYETILTGKVYELTPQDVVPSEIYIHVELTPDVPTDRMSRINAAVQLVKALGYPVEAALDELGETDPAGRRKQAMMETLQNTLIQNEVLKMQSEVQLEIQGKAQMQQMQIQMQAQQAMQPQAPPGGEQPMAGPPGAPGLSPEMGGMGNNPAMGGAPVNTEQGQGTYETQMGSDRQGVENAEPL